MDAAVSVAEQEGLAGLTVARITAAAGHAKGTFYVHFPDRAAFLVALHRRFHDAMFSRIVATTAAERPGPARAGKRLTAFLDGCRALPGVRAVLLEARTEPAVTAEVDRRNRQAATVLAADLAGCCAQPRETARLLVLAAADVAARESDRRPPAPIGPSGAAGADTARPWGGGRPPSGKLFAASQARLSNRASSDPGYLDPKIREIALELVASTIASQTLLS
jgi:AcrR family transcriptional regulator